MTKVQPTSPNSQKVFDFYVLFCNKNFAKEFCWLYFNNSVVQVFSKNVKVRQGKNLSKIKREKISTTQSLAQW